MRRRPKYFHVAQRINVLFQPRRYVCCSCLGILACILASFCDVFFNSSLLFDSQFVHILFTLHAPCPSFFATPALLSNPLHHSQLFLSHSISSSHPSVSSFLIPPHLISRFLTISSFWHAYVRQLLVKSITIELHRLYLASWRHCCCWNDTGAVLLWFNAWCGVSLWCSSSFLYVIDKIISLSSVDVSTEC